MAGQEGSRMQGMDISAGGYNTQLRQQQMAEEMQKRGFSLNEINAIITGQQVGMPSMPGFQNAQRAEGNQALAAAQMTGQAQLDKFNAEQAAVQGMMQGVGSMGMGFMPG
jgi:DNA-binding transcriptional MerR regulator